MAGIYIHIPFCRQACTYCDFHFSTSRLKMDDLVEAICREIKMRADYLPEKELQSIYFGGGTPSLLSQIHLRKIFAAIRENFLFAGNAEITLEANPDDLTREYLDMLVGESVNRLSIGTQSFHEADLRYMNRAHNAVQAREAIENAADAGFSSISIDLIYGTPGLRDELWVENLEIAAELPINHLSCYSLTVEERTPLHKKIRTGILPAPDEDCSAKQFELLQTLAPGFGFEHYEISNLARNGAYAVHNTSYWKGRHYLGVGPSAHSYDGKSRRMNVANNQSYITGVQKGEIPHEIEVISESTRYNELILTGLRTIWGVSESQINSMPAEICEHFRSTVHSFLSQGLILENQGCYTLSPQGLLLADRISAELFY